MAISETLIRDRDVRLEERQNQVIRSGGKIAQVIAWQTSAQLKKIREIIYTRAAGKVSVIVVKKYEPDGTSVSQTLTGTITRAAGKISLIDWVRS